MLGEATFWFCTCVRFIAAGEEIVVLILPVTLIGEDTVEIATSTGEDGSVTASGDGPAIATDNGDAGIVT